jgi:hypothetical protein
MKASKLAVMKRRDDLNIVVKIDRRSIDSVSLIDLLSNRNGLLGAECKEVLLGTGSED